MSNDTRCTKQVIQKELRGATAPVPVVKTVPQSQKLEEEHVINRAGGYTYQIADEEQIKRFQVLGAGQNGTYNNLGP